MLRRLRNKEWLKTLHARGYKDGLRGKKPVLKRQYYSLGYSKGRKEHLNR